MYLSHVVSSGKSMIICSNLLVTLDKASFSCVGIREFDCARVLPPVIEELLRSGRCKVQYLVAIAILFAAKGRD